LPKKVKKSQDKANRGRKKQSHPNRSQSLFDNDDQQGEQVDVNSNDFFEIKDEPIMTPTSSQPLSSSQETTSSTQSCSRGGIKTLRLPFLREIVLQPIDLDELMKLYEQQWLQGEIQEMETNEENALPAVVNSFSMKDNNFEECSHMTKSNEEESYSSPVSPASEEGRSSQGSDLIRIPGPFSTDDFNKVESRPISQFTSSGHPLSSAVGSSEVKC